MIPISIQIDNGHFYRIQSQVVCLFNTHRRPRIRTFWPRCKSNRNPSIHHNEPPETTESRQDTPRCLPKKKPRSKDLPDTFWMSYQVMSLKRRSVIKDTLNRVSTCLAWPYLITSSIQVGLLAAMLLTRTIYLSGKEKKKKKRKTKDKKKKNI